MHNNLKNENYNYDNQNEIEAEDPNGDNIGDCCNISDTEEVGLQFFKIVFSF